MKLWMTPILILLVLAVGRWAKVREDRALALDAERRRWEATREARGVMGEVMDEYDTFDAVQRWIEGRL